MTIMIFEGFNPIIPIVLGLFLFLLSFGIAWWSYSYLSSIKPWKKWTLITLRGCVFLILILLLLNPFFVDRNVEVSKPTINVYLDDSQSLTVERGDYSGLDDYRSIIANIVDGIDDRFDVNFFQFGSTVSEGREINGNGTVTNLQAVIDHQVENQAETVAAVLFSDGIFTQGRSPVFAAQSLSTPLFPVPVGDTTNVLDVVISDVEFNTQSYTNTEQSFSVNINQNGFEGEEITVQFLKDGRLVDSEAISLSETISNHLVLFSDQHTEPGFYEYAINIPGLEGEFTLQNNREEFTVDVIDEKTQIVSLAFEIHPDVGAFRRLIATDQQNELISTTRLSGGRSMGDDVMALDSPPDLIVLHGTPERGDPLLQWITDQADVPVVHFVLPNSYNHFRQLNDPAFIPYSIETLRTTILDVHLFQELDPYSHPLLEFSPQEFRRFPTLKLFRTDISTSGLSEVLFTGEFQRTGTDIPIIITQSSGSRRLTGIHAYGWNSFNRTANETVSNFYTSFFTDLISWTATSPNQQNLAINPVKQTFTETESIDIRATLVNERQQPETDAVLEISVEPLDSSESQSEPQRFIMRHSRNGEYRVNIGNLPEGNYEISGTATKADRRIGQDEARINVSQSMVEFINTQRDDQLLEQLAIRSGGSFLQDASADPLIQYLEENNLDESIESVTEETRFFNSSPIWFVLAILLLTGEWLLRRTLSLP